MTGPLTGLLIAALLAAGPGPRPVGPAAAGGFYTRHLCQRRGRARQKCRGARPPSKKFMF